MSREEQERIEAEVAVDYARSKRSLTCYRIKAEHYVRDLKAAVNVLEEALGSAESPNVEPPALHPLPTADDVRKAITGFHTERFRADKLARRLGIEE